MGIIILNNNPLDDDTTSSHGTAVGGIIGAYRNNNNRVAGIGGGDDSTGNPGVTLYALKVFSSSDGTNRPTGTSSAMAAALIDAAKPEIEGGYGCQIANYSGGQLASNNGAFIEMFLPGNPAYDAMRYAARHNLLFVAAKGNDNTNAKFYPADIKENWVLSVGASDGSDQRALYGGGQGSNWGNNMDLVAPGTTDLVYTTKRVGSGSEGTFSGTSAAAPVVAGVAALLKSQNMALHRDDLEQILKLSAAKVRSDIYIYNNGYNEEMGFGKVNAANSISYLKAPYQLVQNTITGGIIEDISSSQWFSLISGNGLAAGNYYGKRYRVNTTAEKPFCSGENYVWSRIEGASQGWSGANPNNQENYVLQDNETSTSVDFTTWVYFIETNSIGQNINAWYPCAPQDVKFAYTALGLQQYYLPELQIQGTPQFCNTETYTIPNLPSGTTVSWVANPSNLVSISASGNQAVLSALGNGSITLSAVVNSACGNITIGPVNVEVIGAITTTPTPNYYHREYHCDTWNVCFNGGQIYHNAQVGAQTYTYTVGSPWRFINSLGQAVNTITLNANENPPLISLPSGNTRTFGTYRVKANNCYGSSSELVVPFVREADCWCDGTYPTPYPDGILITTCVTPPCGGGGGMDRIAGTNLVIYPNPASEEFTVAAESESDVKEESATEFSLELFNNKGEVMRKLNSKDQSATINIRDIMEGTYFLHIKKGKEIIKKQIIIKH